MLSFLLVVVFSCLLSWYMACIYSSHFSEIVPLSIQKYIQYGTFLDSGHVPEIVWLQKLNTIYLLVWSDNLTFLF